jgi:hypothetical protein
MAAVLPELGEHTRVSIIAWALCHYCTSLSCPGDLDSSRILSSLTDEPRRKKAGSLYHQSPQHCPTASLSDLSAGNANRPGLLPILLTPINCNSFRQSPAGPRFHPGHDCCFSKLRIGIMGGLNGSSELKTPNSAHSARATDYGVCICMDALGCRYSVGSNLSARCSTSWPCDASHDNLVVPIPGVTAVTMFPRQR